MKIQPISTRQVNFKDDNTYIPGEHYTVSNSLQKLSSEGYIVQGKTNADAFEKLHHDLNDDLRKTAQARSSVWHHEWVEGYRFNDKSVKRIVYAWGMSKDKFTKLLTRFWEVNKNNSFKNVDDSVANYLENYEGLKKPSFWEKITSFFSPSEYTVKQRVLKVVTNLFLKNGQHKLK